jgi:hypothetical protein
MPEAKTDQAARFLDLLLEFFDGGSRWIRRRLEDDDGNRCLIGAIEYVRHTYKIRSVEAEAALRKALPKPPFNHLIAFNDTRKSFAEITDLILKARASLLPKPKPSPPTTPPELTAWAERTLRNWREKALRQQAHSAKVTILAQIERERAQRAAAGDFLPFWIIGPGVKRDMARKQAELEASVRADRRLAA